jgi:hypothetical protein
MREMLAVTGALKGAGRGYDCALITDGRFSGGTWGFCIGHVAQFHQTVDKEPQAGMGGKPPGADVGGAQQAEFGQVLHGIADGGRRELDAAPGEGTGTDRLSGLKIALDHPAEDVAGAAVEFG